MQRKKKVLFLTDPSFLKTGLSRNITALLKYLYKMDKYELVHVCCGTVVGTPELNMPPWKCLGVLPNNQQAINELQKDQVRMRLASYGLMAIDQIIEQEKPDIFIGSNDSWSFHELTSKDWFKKINSVLHITLDSLPIKSDQQKQASECKHYYTWTSFAEKELKRVNKDVFKNVGTMHGTLDANIFKPSTLEEKRELKKKFNISEDTVIISMVSRNQLRKLFHTLWEGLIKFKKWYPNKKVKILFNTTNEQLNQSWNFEEMLVHLQHKEGYEGVLKREDCLFGYFCKNCKQIEIKPLQGNDLNCPYCGGQKTQIIPNIRECADEEELVKVIYGISDAYCHCMTSGGLEYSIVEAMLCGLPVATIPYSCGTEFTEEPFVYPIACSKTREVESTFWKAVPDDDSIAKFYNKMYELGPQKRQEIGKKSREWALEQFDISNMGKKWEELIDSLPLIDYEKERVTAEYQIKPETYELKDIQNDFEWIKDLYKNILLVNVDMGDKGVQDWMQSLSQGRQRQDILNYFLQVARQDNQKNKPTDFGETLGKEGKENRILIVTPESHGDELLVTSLLKDLREIYHDKVIYFACKPQFMDVMRGIEHIDHIVPYQDFMDNQLMLEAKYFSLVLLSHVGNQRMISYSPGSNCDRTKIDFNYPISEK